MRTRDDFIKRLHQSPKYQDAIKRARTPEERAFLQASAERFVDSFAGILAPIIVRAEDDPVFAEQLGRRLAEKQGLVTASDPATSGSTG